MAVVDRPLEGPVGLRDLVDEAGANLRWLHENVAGIFSGTMREDGDAIVALATGLGRVARDRQLVAADRERELIVARLDVPGSIAATVQQLRDREISCAEMFHSWGPAPGTDRLLELQRYQFDRKSDAEIAAAARPAVPEPLRAEVRAALAERRRELDPVTADALLDVLWLNDPRYVRLAAPGRVADLVWVLRQGQTHAGVFLHAEEPPGANERRETTVLFAVGNPPQKDFLAQVLEVFNRLDLGVRRSAALTVSTGEQPWFLGSFQVSPRAGAPLEPDSALFRALRRELFNTQILAVDAPAYRDLVLRRVMTGEEASLVNAFIGFCHASLAHAQPHRYTLEDVVRSFHSDPGMALRLVRLFEARFDPEVRDREARWAAQAGELSAELAAYNTGHRMLDDFRRSVFQATLVFIRRTLKTNFFVPEKDALAFRLDPAYLDDLGPDFTHDLPPERPFRVTYFFGRSGIGFHVGFSDIARGGWRTIIAQTRDDYVTAANTVFRETYVLAHTQHLKNKDIYEGGSKLVGVLWAPDAPGKERRDQRLRKMQHGFLNAFLDVFVTEGGRARDPRVVDYYGEDEPIELGPDENMYDAMIETIAELSVRRGYLLGTGLISSKSVGINHKQYGVTSLGVVTFAEIAMRQLGVELRRDPFTVKLTGGPNGDVAGNALRLLLARCPGARIRLIVDGTAALFDPAGLDREALAEIVLRADADAFDPGRLSPGGFLLFRNARRTEGLRELFRRVEMTAAGPREAWVTVDEFHREYGGLLFEVEADLFIPAGGRPETVDGESYRRFLPEGRPPTARVIVEGANSFLTPEARQRLQQAGVVVLRDASANKCGVISSSYEIVGNLLLSSEEFLREKEAYVRDVLAILERRAADEANLIFRRHREAEGRVSYTDLSAAISAEINVHKARLFELFQARPELAGGELCRRALLAHLPALLRERPEYRNRVDRLPPKYRSAILAAEIATSIVYRGGFELDLQAQVERFVAKTFA